MPPTSPTPVPVPVIIGVGDIINRSLSTDPQHCKEPLELMIRAVERAIDDCLGDDGDTDEGKSRKESGDGDGKGENRKMGVRKRKLSENVDSVSVVLNWTWPYRNICNELMKGVGLGSGGKSGKGVYMEETEHGGNQPAKLVDEACRRVGRGECRVAVVVGGEALASLTAYISKKGEYPKHWSPPAGNPATITWPPSVTETTGTIHSIGLPIQVYPLYENAFRAHRNQTRSQNNIESAKLYAEFAKIAAKNEYAWNKDLAKTVTVEKIATPGKRNRMICEPYPLLMNAYNGVNMAASCIITSTQFARDLGVPEERWVYPLGGAGMSEQINFWERPNYYSSTALERSLDMALDVSGLKKEDVDLFDFYSCFPIVPKLAAHHLKIPLVDSQRHITLLGGLTSFGGAGNNYSLHAVTEMTRQLRKRGKAHNGLILANGGVLTYQHVLCLSSGPRTDGKVYQESNPLPRMVDIAPPKVVESVGEGIWRAVIETYTVQYSRGNEPERGFIIGRLKDTGERFIANTGDAATLKMLVRDNDKEVIGKEGWVWREEDGDRNLFGFERGARL
ncbi:hypothetical protein ACMFMG_011510 [Clarireedia jacksonii]